MTATPFSSARKAVVSSKKHSFNSDYGKLETIRIPNLKVICITKLNQNKIS